MKFNGLLTKALRKGWAKHLVWEVQFKNMDKTMLHFRRQHSQKPCRPLQLPVNQSSWGCSYSDSGVPDLEAQGDLIRCRNQDFYFCILKQMPLCCRIWKSSKRIQEELMKLLRSYFYIEPSFKKTSIIHMQRPKKGGTRAHLYRIWIMLMIDRCYNI